MAMVVTAAALVATGVAGGAIVVLKKRIQDARDLIAAQDAKMQAIEAQAASLEGRAEEYGSIPKLFSIKRREVQERSDEQFAQLRAKQTQKDEALDSLKDRLDVIPNQMALNRRQVEALELSSAVKAEQLEKLDRKVSEDFPSLQTGVAHLDQRVVATVQVFDVKIDELEVHSVEMGMAVEAKINEMEMRYSMMGEEFQLKVNSLGSRITAGSALITELKYAAALTAQVTALQQQQQEQAQQWQQQYQQVEQQLKAVQQQLRRRRGRLQWSSSSMSCLSGVSSSSGKVG